jgi:hypothetical protein
MIEIKLNDVIQSLKILKSISQKTLKGRVNFQLAKILRELNNEYNLFLKSREKLISKYGKKENGQLIIDEDGNYSINKNQLFNFNLELNELLDTKIDLNAEKIALKDIEDIDFTIEQMVALSPFIKEEEQDSN